MSKLFAGPKDPSASLEEDDDDEIFDEDNADDDEGKQLWCNFRYAIDVLKFGILWLILLLIAMTAFYLHHYFFPLC